jgi:hypothetical protein
MSSDSFSLGFAQPVRSIRKMEMQNTECKIDEGIIVLR